MCERTEFLGITTYYVLFYSSDELSGSGESSGDIDKSDEDENKSKKMKIYLLYCLTAMQRYATFVNILYFCFYIFRT